MLHAAALQVLRSPAQWLGTLPGYKRLTLVVQGTNPPAGMKFKFYEKFCASLPSCLPGVAHPSLAIRAGRPAGAAPPPGWQAAAARATNATLCLLIALAGYLA